MPDCKSTPVLVFITFVLLAGVFAQSTRDVARGRGVPQQTKFAGTTGPTLVLSKSTTPMDVNAGVSGRKVFVFKRVRHRRRSALRLRRLGRTHRSECSAP